MRTFLIAVLLSGAAASPALAQDWNDHGHHHNQQNNNNGHEEHQRGQGQAERGNRNGGGNYYRQQAPQVVRQQPVQEGQRRAWNGQRFDQHRNVVVQQGQVQQQVYRGNRGGYNGEHEQVRNGWNGQHGTWNGQHGTWNGQHGTWNGQHGTWNGQRGTWSGQRNVRVREGTRYAGSWNRNWRNDRRYDWRRYRNGHRSAFHLGIYYDPFGYGYRSFNIGYRLAPVYFGQQYWIDPAMYQLPYPPPGTQWIRYWNDAVLVDMYSGQVVDVIHDFFW